MVLLKRKSCGYVNTAMHSSMQDAVKASDSFDLVMFMVANARVRGKTEWR